MSRSTTKVLGTLARLRTAQSVEPPCTSTGTAHARAHTRTDEETPNTKPKPTKSRRATTQSNNGEKTKIIAGADAQNAHGRCVVSRRKSRRPAPHATTDAVHLLFASQPWVYGTLLQLLLLLWHALIIREVSNLLP